MIENISYYNLFLKAIEKYGPIGFSGIDPNDPLMVELEQNMKEKDQFFYFGDLILFQIIYTSKRSIDLIGIEPDVMNGLNLLIAVHPDDMKRHLLGRATLIKLAHELFIAEKGYKVISSNFRIKNAEGKYINLLHQFFIYYSTIPYKSVFTLKVHTNIDWFKKHKHGFHYYIGDDLSNFRYPDQDLLMKGNVFSRREFEIIEMLEKGLSNEQVAGQLYLSPNTVKTHRRNILVKAQKANLPELIYDLKAQGLL
jgi:hypothetical protein